MAKIGAIKPSDDAVEAPPRRVALDPERTWQHPRADVRLSRQNHSGEIIVGAIMNQDAEHPLISMLEIAWLLGVQGNARATDIARECIEAKA